MTTVDGWLREILRCPGDDALRLFYADSLEERGGPGDAEHAEFVRVQVLRAAQAPNACQVGKCLHGCPEVWCEVASRNYCREYDLLLWFCREDWAVVFGLPNHTSMYPVESGLTCPGEGIDLYFRRGFVEEVRLPLLTWTGSGVCEGCYGSDEHGFAGHGNWRKSECPRCRGTGTLPGVGPALVAVQPVTTVVCSDRVLCPHYGGGSWWDGGRHGASDYHEASNLPAKVYRLLTGGRVHSDCRVYDSTEEGAADLSLALLKVAHDQP